MTRDEYPEAERLDLIEELHGIPVADPYRWLEDRGDPRTAEWCTRQDALYTEWRESLPDSAWRFRRRLNELADAGNVSVPVWRGGRSFLLRRGPGDEHAVLRVLDEEGGTERVLVDPTVLDPTGACTLDGWFPSPDGRLLAYLLSTGGNERPSLRVLDVDEAADTADEPIERAASHAVAWLPDSTGFYYQCRPTAEQIADGVDAHHLLVYLRRLGTASLADVLISGPASGVPKTSWYVPCISPDGRWLQLDAEAASDKADVYLADLTACPPEAPQFVPFQVGADGLTKPKFAADGLAYALTRRQAPNARLCVVDPVRPQYPHWRTLVPEEPGSVLEDFAILGGPEMKRPRLVLLRSRHAISELTLHDLATGEPLPGSEVKLPGLGSIKELAAHPDGTHVYFSYTDFRTPPSVYRLDGRNGAVEQWAAAPGADGLGVGGPGTTGTAGTVGAAVHVDQVTYSSYDGTVVRMFILSPTGRPDRPRPTILYGYGAHGNSRTPAFNALQLAWVEAGGVYAVANIRGGGEEGEAWHHAGRREKRQNAFADFHAAADHLVDQGWTTRDRLGVHGGSAGGTLVGAALTQRPDAYAAVLCSAPMLDMVRAELTGAASLWTLERGTARDPEQLPWLLEQSPYHLVREGAAYPALLLTVFTGDARVDPLHAYKFAAALQHATSAPRAQRPILLRREDNVGHTARSVSRSVALWADQLGFFASRLGF